MPKASAWIALAIGLPWLQYAVGINWFAGDALLSSLYLSGLLAAVFVGYSLARNDDAQLSYCLTGLMHSLWIAAIVSAAIGLAQWLNVDGHLGMYVVQSDPGDRAMGNLGQPNQLATLLLMGMAAFLYVYERGVIGRFTFFLGIGFLTGVLILAQSRAGMLSVVVVAGFLIWKKRTVQSRLSAKAVGGWVICFLIGVWLLPFLSEALLLSDVRSIRDASPISQRLRMWQQVAYAVAQSPWVGYGWNQTPVAHAAGAIAFPGSIPYNYAHNFVMDMLAWNGLPLGLLLCGAIAWWFVTRIRTSVRLDAVHAMACLLPLAVHSMLEYPFAYAYFLMAAGFMVGVVEAARVPTRTIMLNVRWAWGFLALSVPVGSYLTYEYFLIEEDFRTVRFESLRIGKTPAEYEIPHVWMISHLAAMLKASRLVVEPGMSTADLENLRQVSQRFAYGQMNCRYAIALGLNGQPVGARHQLAIVRGMYGDKYQAACKLEIRRLEQEKYPQLAAVLVP
ncbi:PglL family O-oligosaccharyltransferase [Rhodoferax antarcticus]|nr:O-antigen ligase family protein [Rhodoferax antarcticus]